MDHRLSRRAHLRATGAVALAGLGGCAGRSTLKRLVSGAGSGLWTVQIAAGETVAPAVDGETVFAATTAGTVHAFDAGTGERRWTAETDGPVVGPPAIGESAVYVGSANGTVYALAPGSGDQRWTASTDDPVAAAPAVEDGTVYASARQLYALDAASGQRRWTSEPTTAVDVSPLPLGARILAGSSTAGLYAVEAATGQRLWSFELPNGITSPPVRGERAIFAGGPEALYAVRPDGSEQLWSTDIAARASMYMDGYVYVTDDDTLYRLGGGADREWSFAPGRPITAPVAGLVVVGRVYVADRGERLSAVDIGDGKHQWTFETDGVVRAAPATDEGTVYVGTDAGRLHAVGES